MQRDEEALIEYFKSNPSRFNAIDLDRLPVHIAIIMDGNGRWASQRGLTRDYGHAAGVESLRETITACVRLGIDVLTVYAFSTENWSRPPEEVNLLMSLFAHTLIEELPLLMKEHVRLCYLGDMDALPEETRTTFMKGLNETASNDGMVLAVAVNYGSRTEIVHAAQNLAEKCIEGTLTPASITPEVFSSALYTDGIPDPELLIRTSGECRLSNYLLWQCAYTEFVFDEALWPDFNRWNLVDDLIEYQGRQRRFGGV